MSRLTKKIPEYENAVCKDGSDDCGCDCENCQTLTLMINKLAEYEDAEEQGLLLRLPCKVGTPAYIITNGCLDANGTPWHFCFNKGCKDCENKIDVIAEIEYATDSMRSIVNNLGAFGKKIYLNKSEAEKALGGETV